MYKTLKEELERNTEFQICKEKNTGHRVNLWAESK